MLLETAVLVEGGRHRSSDVVIEPQTRVFVPSKCICYGLSTDEAASDDGLREGQNLQLNKGSIVPVCDFFK